MEMHIYNIDPYIVKKIDERAKEKKQSRTVFLAEQLTALFMLPEKKELEDQYAEEYGRVLQVLETLSISMMQLNKTLQANSQIMEEYFSISEMNEDD